LRVDRAGQSTPIAETDTWAPELAARFAGVGAFALGGDTRSAALVLELEAGAYTAQLGGNAGGTGVALVEVYDASTGQPSELRNLSTRAEAGAGDDMLIAGLVITGDAPLPVLLRGVGPGLSAFGITGALVDPILRVYEPIPGGDSRLVATNDDWNLAADSGAVRSAAAAVGAFALNDFGRDASLLLHLEPGAYTVHLSGSSGSGLALLEVYSLPLP